MKQSEEEDEHKSGAARGSSAGTPAAMPSSARSGAAGDKGAGNGVKVVSGASAPARDRAKGASAGVGAGQGSQQQRVFNALNNSEKKLVSSERLAKSMPLRARTLAHSFGRRNEYDLTKNSPTQVHDVVSDHVIDTEPARRGNGPKQVDGEL